ncbi:hypothetical protein RY831_27650 [Noviherbaspirillum sp. CPCC 100848]|uniref:Uncharacterized protein n=1 Tax=Noviherbaspirillum album TaxID=3080276 RepID=A0ABU6JIP6_9BURK|nr:hypothetical protein [Noviherbaspirillum sp. CPCC 100848]MEC4722939.1 hypothetical protein [Noviherbaspirillum sp. CPCC 100848]
MAGFFQSSGSGRLRVMEFRASGSFPVPAGLKTVSLFLVGGGGASNAQTYAGQGGNIVKINYDVTGKASCVVVIGAGGTNGGDGGSTTFDGAVVAVGGKGNVGITNPMSIADGGEDGFGGHGIGYASTAAFITANGGAMNAAAGANSGGGGGGATGTGGSGYLRVEWYE